jgi:hypothetical protein
MAKTGASLRGAILEGIGAVLRNLQHRWHGQSRRRGDRVSQ